MAAEFTGQTYGQAKQQEQSQQMVAPGRPPTDVQPSAPRPLPNGLLGPSNRPTEPITAGADFGAGPNSAQAGMPRRILPDTSLADKMMALYEIYPSDRLRLLIQQLLSGR